MTETINKWLPIDTAPKDGTSVLCYNAKKDFQAVDWWRTKDVNCSYIGFGKQNDKYWPHTHWQPLPTPPETK